MELETQEKLKNNYDSLLLGYATGTLDMAQNLAVETHLTFSQDARNFVHECECIGGTLLENECGEIKMSDKSLENVLAKLDTDYQEERPQQQDFTHESITFDIPEPLKTPLSSQKKIAWRPMMPGFKSYDIELACKKSTARFLQVAPGVKSPSHRHGGTEITLVLDGAFSDNGENYKTGDLIVIDEDIEHAPMSCKFEGCTCLVVSTAPIKLTGVASILNPFLKP